MFITFSHSCTLYYYGEQNICIHSRRLIIFSYSFRLPSYFVITINKQILLPKRIEIPLKNVTPNTFRQTRTSVNNSTRLHTNQIFSYIKIPNRHDTMDRGFRSISHNTRPLLVITRKLRNRCLLSRELGYIIKYVFENTLEMTLSGRLCKLRGTLIAVAF